MKKVINNLALAIFNISLLVAGIILAEYDFSKLRKPEAGWLATNPYLDLTLSGIVILISILNLAMLILIAVKGLENRKWLWGSTLMSIMALAAIALILNIKLLLILFP